MKSTTGIDQQISRVQPAIMALKATSTDAQSITIRGNGFAIRAPRSAHCMCMLEQGKACYLYTGHDHGGHLRQGALGLHGCRVVRLESSWQSAQQEES